MLWVRGTNWVLPAVALAAAVAAAPGIASAERKVSVTIDSAPEGAEIFLDDVESEPIGTTPLRAKLSPGSYNIILRKDGYDLEFQSIDVKRRGRNRLNVSLNKTPQGYVILRAADGRTAQLDGASVTVDGKSRGEVPLELDLDAGPHEIAIEKDGYKSQVLWIELDEGATKRIEVDLVSLSPQPKGQTRQEPSDAPGPGDGAVSASAPPRPRTQPVAIVAAGFEVGGRRFRYQNAVTTNLREYDAGVVPRARLSAEFYPMALLSSGPLSGLGLTASYGRAAPLTSFVKSDGARVDTTWQDYDLGLRYQHPFGSLRLGGGVSYGAQSFEFDAANPLSEETPGVDYRFIRVGVDAGWSVLPRAMAVLGIDVMLVSALGTADERFASAAANAFGGKLGGNYAITDSIVVEVEATYSLYQHTYEPASDMQYVADGGTDHILVGLVGGAYRF